MPASVGKKKKCDLSYIHLYREGEYRYIHMISAVNQVPAKAYRAMVTSVEPSLPSTANFGESDSADSITALPAFE